MNISPDRNIRPAIHRIGPLSLAPDVVSMLPNGITLHVVDNGPNEVCRLGIVLPGGLAESRVAGEYEMISKLLPEGSVHTPGSRMADMLETNGAWVMPSISTHHTVLNTFALCSVFSNILPLAREMAFEPSFEPEAVSRVARRMSSNIAVNQCKVGYLATKALNPAMFGATNPLAQMPDPDTVLGFTPEALREAHIRRLDLREVHIYLAGKISAEMIDAVTREFGRIDIGVRFALTEPVFEAYPEPCEIFTPMPDALQNGVRIALPVPGRDNPDFIRLRIATCALGGYFGSRLMANIREDKGLTYGITSALYGYPENGYMVISTETACENTDLVISESISEIERLKDESTFTHEELDSLTSFQMSGLAAVLDTPFQRMDFLQNQVLADTPSDYFARQYEAVSTTTAATIAETAARYFDTSRVIVSVAGKRIVEATS
ncbi:MAG: insulinase family protein [Muribaculaceae bacterium]|nr:insulinase family protein [Muribaculaceae bacterium]